MPGIPGRYELRTWHNSDPDTNRKERCIMMAIKPQAFNAAAECCLWSRKIGGIPVEFREVFCYCTVNGWKR